MSMQIKAKMARTVKQLAEKLLNEKLDDGDKYKRHIRSSLCNECLQPK